MIKWDRLTAPSETNLVDGIGNYADVIIDKTTYSTADQIAEVLRERGINRVYLCGTDGGTEAHDAAYYTLQRTIGKEQVLRQP